MTHTPLSTPRLVRPSPGGSYCSHQGIQSLVSRPGGAPAPRFAPPLCPQHDHGLPGDTDHEPGPRQPTRLVRLCVEQDPWYS